MSERTDVAEQMAENARRQAEQAEQRPRVVAQYVGEMATAQV
jgi:hypothetical protein